MLASSLIWNDWEFCLGEFCLCVYFFPPANSKEKEREEKKETHHQQQKVTPVFLLGEPILLEVDFSSLSLVIVSYFLSVFHCAGDSGQECIDLPSLPCLVSFHVWVSQMPT
jgi:hypothetical protein